MLRGIFDNLVTGVVGRRGLITNRVNIRDGGDPKRFTNFYIRFAMSTNVDTNI